MHIICQPPANVHRSSTQALWVSSIPREQTASTVKTLFSDGGSGLLFNLGPDVLLNQVRLGSGAFILPINTRAYSIHLPPNANLAGVRFHPGYGRGVLGRPLDRPIRVAKTHDLYTSIADTFIQLKNPASDTEKVSVLQHWLDTNIPSHPLIPAPLEQAIQFLRRPLPIRELELHVGTSQRQIERLFKLWLGITPKHMQRIFRVKQAVEHLRVHSPVDLAQMSVDMGFSDQAHMTREFRHIALTTPGQFIAKQRSSNLGPVNTNLRGSAETCIALRVAPKFPLSLL